MQYRAQKAILARASIAPLNISRDDPDILQQNQAANTIFAAKSNPNNILFCIFTTLYSKKKKFKHPIFMGDPNSAKVCCEVLTTPYFLSSFLNNFKG